jgi:hypothetical protein
MESLHIASKDGHNVKVSGSDAGSPKIFDEGVSNVPAKYRGTDADKRDMTNLGKKQVLRVSICSQVKRDLADLVAAELQLHNHARICLHLRG